MKSVLSGRTKAAVIGATVATTGIVGVFLALPATAAKSYNLMLTEVPADATSVVVLVKKPSDDWTDSKRQCFQSSQGREINTRITVSAGERVSTMTFPTTDCQPDPNRDTELGSSPDQGSVPANLTTTNYWFKVGPTSPLPAAPSGAPAG